LRRAWKTAVVKAAIGVAAALPLSACGYDYLQQTDRVGYSAGNAVRANIESETINPSRRSLYSTAGLGKNGKVIPADATAAASTPSGSASGN